LLGKTANEAARARIDVAYNRLATKNMLERAKTSGSLGTASGTAERRILAVDYGRKRIGLALSDELGVTAQPLLTLVRTNYRNDLRRLREICREHSVGRIIVGHPLHMTGAAGEMAAEAERFSIRLRKNLGLPVELVDERLTTWAAEQIAAETKPSRNKKQPLDAVAAAVLLRDYLERTTARADSPAGAQV